MQYALLISLDKNSNYWVNDFGASFHATSYRTCFLDYVQVEFGHVLLGNNHPCKIVGMDKILIKLPNENQWLLKEAMYIHDLKRILFSVGKLDDEGYTIAFDDHSWKVTKGSMIVPRYKMVSTLYLLTNTCEYSMDLAYTCEDVALWHHMLEHMS